MRGAQTAFSCFFNYRTKHTTLSCHTSDCKTTAAVKINDKVEAIAKRRSRGSESPNKKQRVLSMSDQENIETSSPKMQQHRPDLPIVTTKKADQPQTDNSGNIRDRSNEVSQVRNSVQEQSLKPVLLKDTEQQPPSPDSVDDELEKAVESWMDEDPESNDVAVPDLEPEVQVAHIENLVNYTALADGDTWYIVAKNWYSRWEQYCSRLSSSSPTTRELGQRTPPGPVDNSSIIHNGELKPNLESDEDFKLVPEEAWNCLCKWYGTPSTTLARQVITEGEYLQQTLIEIYPPTFTFCLISSSTTKQSNTLERPPRVTLSRKTKISDFKATICNSLDLSLDEDIRVWQLADAAQTIGSSAELPVTCLRDAEFIDITHTDRTVGDNSISSGYYAVEKRNPNTKSFPSEEAGIRPTSDSSSVSSSASSMFASNLNTLTSSSASPPFSSTSTYAGNRDDNTFGVGWMNKNVAANKPKGVCGLSNLGNTCFMNSALQCLSNTQQLSQYFLSGKYKEELNRDNPLGMKGEVAEAYGSLVEKLWSGTASHTAPREFKLTISRFNPTFTGYLQHDSQELLAFLLDGLHEDLNRILKKPYIELPDFDDMPDEEIAERSWSYHKARNDSVIVDLFQGQFKSRLVCSECGKVSVTFDPFMYLSLPLPIQKKMKTTITYVPYNPSQRPLRITLTLNKDATIKTLKEDIADKVDIEDPQTLLVLELFNEKIYKLFANSDSVAEIGQNDIIYVYQMPCQVPKIQSSSGFGYRLGGRLSLDEDDDGATNETKESNGKIIFPVYCEAVPDAEDGKMSSPSQFGGPMILAIDEKDATTLDNVYRLVAQHIERFAAMKLFEEAPESTDMDVDSPAKMEVEEPLSPQQPIHTAAAVTAAGGKHMEPMRNLFSIKVFAEERSYGRRSGDLFPVGMSGWNTSRLTDLRERAEKENAQIEVEETESTHSDEVLASPTTPPSSDTSEGPRMLLNKENDNVDELADEYDNEIVEDAASSWPQQTENTRSIIVTPPKPIKKPSNYTFTPKVNHQAPPKTVIRQGEGLVLQWRLKKAQQVFGIAKKKSSSYSFGATDTGVNDDAWNDYEDLGDPQAAADSNEKKDVTLADCLDEFTKEELLSEEDLWYCPRCKDHKRASKKFDLWRLPEIVVVHLKRFSHTRTWRDKIDAYIDFPMKGLDLTDRVLSISNPDQVAPEDRLIYDLYGVDNHFGGMGGGHYTAYAQNWENGKWYNFDDAHVSEVDANEAKTSAAYLLFYKRRRNVMPDEPSSSLASTPEDTSTTS